MNEFFSSDEESTENIISEDSVLDAQKSLSETVLNNFTTTIDSASTSINDNTEMWWDKLKEVVSREQQCKIENCKFAPPGHRAHPMFRGYYSECEEKLMIKYLIFYDEIYNGKGLRVWEEMHSRGYMQHRPIESLKNNFRRILLRDIELYNLPKELEKKFLELRT